MGCPEGRICVDSREEWNDTGHKVIAGRTYRYSAKGVWCDSYIPTDADGYEKGYLWPFRFGRRVKDQPWFRLVAMVDRQVQVILGTWGEFTAPALGAPLLLCQRLADREMEQLRQRLPTH